MTDNTRRDFLKQAALGTAAFVAYSTSPVLGANDRIRVGMIGVGNRGQELLKQAISVPNTQLVAIADVYTRRHDEAKKMAPGIQTFDDHRRLLDMKDPTLSSWPARCTPTPGTFSTLWRQAKISIPKKP